MVETGSGSKPPGPDELVDVTRVTGRAPPAMSFGVVCPSFSRAPRSQRPPSPILGRIPTTPPFPISCTSSKVSFAQDVDHAAQRRSVPPPLLASISSADHVHALTPCSSRLRSRLIAPGRIGDRDGRQGLCRNRIGSEARKPGVARGLQLREGQSTLPRVITQLGQRALSERRNRSMRMAGYRSRCQRLLEPCPAVMKLSGELVASQRGATRCRRGGHLAVLSSPSPSSSTRSKAAVKKGEVRLDSCSLREGITCRLHSRCSSRLSRLAWPSPPSDTLSSRPLPLCHRLPFTSCSHRRCSPSTTDCSSGFPDSRLTCSPCTRPSGSESTCTG